MIIIIVSMLSIFIGAFFMLMWITFGSDDFIKKFNNNEIKRLEKYNLALNQKIMEVCEHNELCRKESMECYFELEKLKSQESKWLKN